MVIASPRRVLVLHVVDHALSEWCSLRIIGMSADAYRREQAQNRSCGFEETPRCAVHLGSHMPAAFPIDCSLTDFTRQPRQGLPRSTRSATNEIIRGIHIER